MLELINNTSWLAELFPGTDPQGQEQITCVIKTGFGFDYQGQLAKLEIMEPIRSHDIFYQNDPKNHSITAAEESMPFKYGGELLIHGHAKPNRSNCRLHDVSVAVKFINGNCWHKTLRIFGKRWWRSRLTGLMLTKPEPLTAVRLCYENAYGGRDPQAPEYNCLFNPVGKGYARFSRHLKDTELPQIESKTKFITSPRTRPQPVGFTPVARSYAPRIEYCQSHNQATKLHARLHNVAPSDQQFATAFVAGDEIALHGMISQQRKDMPVSIKLPSIIVNVYYDSGDKHQRLTPAIDTVTVDVDRQTIYMLFRCRVAWDSDIARQGCITIKE